MKARNIAIFCALAMGAQADFSQFDTVKGSMDVFDHVFKVKGTYLWSNGWGLADLQAITTNNLTFELKPNINNYEAAIVGDDGARAYWTDSSDEGVTIGDDGNKWMSANTVWERTVGVADTSASFTYSVDSYMLDARYAVRAFVKVLDSIGQSYSELTIDSEAITQVTGSDVTLNIDLPENVYTGQLLQVGFVMEGMNANPETDWGSVTVTAVDASVTIVDNEAPTPNPMGFAIAPNAISDSSISMTASNAVDNAFGVEYYFICDTDRSFDSDWQESPLYIVSGLASETEYTFRVTVRDTSPMQNTAVPSAEASATTLVADTVAPTPNPMEIVSSSSIFNAITLTAATAMDDAAVEYKFTNVSGGGNDSGWQSSPVYTDSGLLPGSAYAYTVQARDLSSATNITASSESVTVVTESDVPDYRLIPNGDFSSNGDYWTNAEGGAVQIDYTQGYAELNTAPTNPVAPWAVLVNPPERGDQGGGIDISTLELAAGDSVTFIIDLITLSGSGIPGLKVEAWASNVRLGDTGDIRPESVPNDWTTFTVPWTLPAGTEKLIFVALWGNTSTVGFDNVGVIYTSPPAATMSGVSVPVDGALTFNWTGVAGESYSIQYKEKLTDNGWITDSNIGTVTASEDGSMEVTANLGLDQVFYRIITH